MTKTQKELATLFPVNRVVKVNGEDIAVKVLSVRQIGQLSQLIVPIWESVGEMELPGLVAKHYEDFAAILAVATGADKDALLDAPYDEFAVLLDAVWERNKDVFLTGIWPKVKGAVAKMPSTPGQTASTLSDAMAMLTPKATPEHSLTPT